MLPPDKGAKRVWQDRTGMEGARSCPDCRKPMHAYGTQSPVQATPLTIGVEIVQYIGVVVLPIVLWALGITGGALVIASALIVVVAVLWKPYASAQRTNEEQSDLYHCDACHGYFEGNGLRRITAAEAKRATSDANSAL
jgi:hypothetical protein